MAEEFLEVKITGLDEVQKALEELPEKVARKNLRAALKAGANVIKAGQMAMAPHDTGFEQEHIDIRTRLRGDELAGTAYIGPNRKIVRPERLNKAAKSGKPWRQWTAEMVAKFFEFGTSKMAKKPFLTQGYENSKERAVEVVVQFLKDKLGL